MPNPRFPTEHIILRNTRDVRTLQKDVRRLGSFQTPTLPVYEDTPADIPDT